MYVGLLLRLVALVLCSLSTQGMAHAAVTLRAQTLLAASHSYDSSSASTTPATNTRTDAAHGEHRSARAPQFSTSSLCHSSAAKAGAGAPRSTFMASDGTEIVGFTKHGINRAIGHGAKRAGTRPEAILDAIRNPTKISEGVDDFGGRSTSTAVATLAWSLIRRQGGSSRSTRGAERELIGSPYG